MRASVPIVVSLHADHVAAIRPTLLLLQAGAIALLLIGAVNLVNLLLVRASGRVKELAVRQALGASRGYVVSEVVVETTLLTLVGGLLGLAVGAGGIHLLGALGADRLPLGGRIAFDARLALVALVAAIVMGVAAQLTIAWFNLRQPSRSMRCNRRAGVERAGALLKSCAIASSSLRLPWHSCCWPEPVCSASVFSVRWQFLRASGPTTSSLGISCFRGQTTRMGEPV